MYTVLYCCRFPTESRTQYSVLHYHNYAPTPGKQAEPPHLPPLYPRELLIVHQRLRRVAGRVPEHFRLEGRSPAVGVAEIVLGLRGQCIGVQN
jgi:hypothetical protein